MITTTFNKDVLDFSAHGEFVFTYGNVVIKIDYTIDEEGSVWIADIKYERHTLVQKLEKLLDGENLSFTTMNGNLSFVNNNNGLVSLKLESNHSYHGFRTEATCNLQEFVRQFKNSLDNLFQQFEHL